MIDFENAVLFGYDEGHKEMTAIGFVHNIKSRLLILDALESVVRAENMHRLQSCIVEFEFDTKRFNELFNPPMPQVVDEKLLQHNSRRPFYDNYNSQRHWRKK